MKCYSDGLNGVLLLGLYVRGKYAEEKDTEGVQFYLQYTGCNMSPLDHPFFVLHKHQFQILTSFPSGGRLKGMTNTDQQLFVEALVLRIESIRGYGNSNISCICSKLREVTIKLLPCFTIRRINYLVWMVPMPRHVPAGHMPCLTLIHVLPLKAWNKWKIAKDLLCNIKLFLLTVTSLNLHIPTLPTLLTMALIHIILSEEHAAVWADIYLLMRHSQRTKKFLCLVEV